MDDLLIRTGDVWNRAAARLLPKYGRQWTPALEVHYKGMNCPDVAGALRRVLGIEQTPQVFAGEYRQALIEEFPKKPQAMKGAVELVRLLHERRQLMAVASGSPMALIERTVAQLEIAGCFSYLISSESVARGKPYPDVFLAAAMGLRIEPADCLVFEDSPAGVAAARAAAMTCFCVPSADPTLIKNATRMFTSLADITPADLGL